MPQLGVSINRTYVRAASGESGAPRAVLDANIPAKPIYRAPLYLKVLATLSTVAALAMAAALWRLMHFPH